MEICKRFKTKVAVTFIASSLLTAAATGKQNRTPAPVSLNTEDTTKVNTDDTTNLSEVTCGQSLDTVRTGKDVGMHKATWYSTAGHLKVHRQYPTAAYNLAPIGTKLLVTNVVNKKSCTVVVTDRMAKHQRKIIDLSHLAFGIIADHSRGTVPVQIVILD